MQFEKPSPGNAAARAARTHHDWIHHRADERSGGLSRFRDENPSFDADIDAVAPLGWGSHGDWNSASGMPTIFLSDGFQHLSDTRVLLAPDDPEPARDGSAPDTLWGTIGSALSWLTTQIVEGFALSASVTHSEFIWPLGEYLGDDDPAEDDDWQHRPSVRSRGAFSVVEHAVVNYRPLPRSAEFQPAVRDSVASDAAAQVETAKINLSRWSEWAISVFARLRSRALHWREINRMKTDWRMMDDRTLRDIGLTRHDVDLDIRPGHRWD